jgi:transposase InsO family protein
VWGRELGIRLLLAGSVSSFSGIGRWRFERIRDPDLKLGGSADPAFRPNFGGSGNIENLSERKIKILRSDNGGEYTSKEFVNFCKDVGIKRELATPYNPQQNGVVERKNKTIMEAVKTMIHDQHLPMCLWAEARKTTVYVQNRLSYSVLGFKTPEEMFSGKKPEVNHLKIFGCLVFVHIPKEKRTKLDLQSVYTRLPSYRDQQGHNL